MTQRGGGPLFLCVLAGLLLGGLCTVGGLAVTGMGHGWEIPFQYGLLSCLFYPLAVVRLAWVSGRLPWRRDVAVTAGVALPLMAGLCVFGMLPFFLGGWPLFVVGVPLYWFAGRVAERTGKQAIVGDVALLVVGAALDWAALTDHATSGYAARSFPAQLYWMPLWLGWQLLAAVAVLKHVRGRVPA